MGFIKRWQKNRHERRLARINGRTEVRTSRSETRQVRAVERTNRANARADARATAYENGIDPRAANASVINKAIDAASNFIPQASALTQTLDGILPGNGSFEEVTKDLEQQEQAPNSANPTPDNSMLYYGAGAVFLAILLNSK